MGIVVNDNGTLRTLASITTNDAGTLHNLSSVTTNDNGTLRNIFSSWADPIITWKASKDGSTYGCGSVQSVSDNGCDVTISRGGATGSTYGNIVATGTFNIARNCTITSTVQLSSFSGVTAKVSILNLDGKAIPSLTTSDTDGSGVVGFQQSGSLSAGDHIITVILYSVSSGSTGASFYGGTVRWTINFTPN